jgi:hypothetical protein
MLISCWYLSWFWHVGRSKSHGSRAPCALSLHDRQWMRPFVMEACVVLHVESDPWTGIRSVRSAWSIPGQLVGWTMHVEHSYRREGALSCTMETRVSNCVVSERGRLERRKEAQDGAELDEIVAKEDQICDP